MKILRKLALSLLILLTLLPAYAGGVSRDKAAETAASFFRRQPKRASTSAGVRMMPAGEQSPAYAAFNRESGGFVVIALNDVVPPVLAYSNQGSFPSWEEMPEAMRWWFTSLAEQINAIPADVVATDAVRLAWDNPEPVRSASKLYETASWCQTDPFNNNCPIVNDQRCVTGCVATAGAIIARFFQWPDAGVGNVPAKPSNVGGPDYPAHDLGHSYDWANMPLQYGNSYTTAQAEEVASLMYDMGTIAQMGYGLTGSSANTSSLLSGLKQYMKYDKGAYEANRSEYTDAQWRQLLTEILDNYGPTVYSGLDPSYGAHAFVMDGYDAEGRFHFNWGWGYADCYCTLDSFTPESTLYNFSDRQRVFVGLIPDYDGTSTEIDRLYFEKNGSNIGLSTNVTEYAKDVYFYCTAASVRTKINPFKGMIYVSLYDKKGNLKQKLFSWYASLDVNDSVGMSNNCVITCDIEPGDRIKAWFVGQNSEGFVVAGPDCVDEIIVMEDSGGGDEPDPTAGYSAAETAASTSLSYDKAGGILTLTFAHPANWEVKNSGGTAVSSGTATGGGNVAISLSGLASGTYTISIGSAEDPFSFTITK